MIDMASVARGLSEVVGLTAEIQMQSKAKRKADIVEAKKDDDNKKPKLNVLCILDPHLP